MPSKVASLTKLLVADGTLERLLVGVHGEVNLEAASLTKLLVADGTLEWLLAGVGPEMLPEVTSVTKLLVADGTLERLLPGVGAEVDSERRLRGDDPSALVAFENHDEGGSGSELRSPVVTS